MESSTFLHPSFPSILSSQTTTMPETIYTAYAKIHTAWNTNVSTSDIYHMIIDWIDTWNSTIVHQHRSVAALVDDFKQRAYEGEETNDLVEAFIYGKRYSDVREAFLKD